MSDFQSLAPRQGQHYERSFFGGWRRSKPEYRTFHRRAWAGAVAALKAGGTFTVNIKNHVRAGEVQRVAEWHIDTLMHEFGLRLVALDVVPTRGLMAGANDDVRTTHELVATFRKEVAS